MIKYEVIQEALDYQNRVSQGLSSAIFTRDLHESEVFHSHQGSDYGMANVNIGTSGAEIGSAFGGGREAESEYELFRQASADH